MSPTLGSKGQSRIRDARKAGQYAGLFGVYEIQYDELNNNHRYRLPVRFYCQTDDDHSPMLQLTPYGIAAE